MSWFDTAGFANLAKSALKEAQKTFDKALDLEPEEKSSGVDDTSDSFFSAFGLGSHNSSSAGDPGSSTSSNPTSSTASSLWGALNAVSLIKAQSGGDDTVAPAQTESNRQQQTVVTAPPHSQLSPCDVVTTPPGGRGLPLLRERTPSGGDVAALLVESPAADGFSRSVLVVAGDQALDVSSPCLPASTPESIEILDDPGEPMDVINVLDAAVEQVSCMERDEAIRRLSLKETQYKNSGAERDKVVERSYFGDTRDNVSSLDHGEIIRPPPLSETLDDSVDASDSTPSLVCAESEDSLHSSNSSCHTLVAANVSFTSAAGTAVPSPQNTEQATSPQSDSASSESFVGLGLAGAVSQATTPDTGSVCSPGSDKLTATVADQSAPEDITSELCAQSSNVERTMGSMQESLSGLKVDAWERGDWDSVVDALSPSSVEIVASSPELHDRPATGTSSSEPKTASDVEVITSPDLDDIPPYPNASGSLLKFGPAVPLALSGNTPAAVGESLTSPELEVVTSPDEVEVIRSSGAAEKAGACRSGTLTRSRRESDSSDVLGTDASAGSVPKVLSPGTLSSVAHDVPPTTDVEADPISPSSSVASPTAQEGGAAEVELSTSSSYTDVVSSPAESAADAMSSSLATEPRTEPVLSGEGRGQRELSETPPREPWQEQPSSGSADSTGRGTSPHESAATSADELETATSSDVEVLASPATEMNTRLLVGCGGATVRRKLTPQERADTPSSDGSHQHKPAHGDTGHQRNLSQTSVASSDLEVADAERAHRRLHELQEVLAARETKMLELSKLNVTLQEEQSNMQSRIQYLEMRLTSASSGNLEKQQLLNERDALQHELQEWRRRCTAGQRELTERDTTIQELREEGEKLSKEQFKHNTVIKKLRARERELEATAKKHQDKIDKLGGEITSLTEQLSTLRESEKEQRATHRQLTSQLTKAEQEAREDRDRAAGARAETEALQTALQTAEKECAALEKKLREADSEAAALTLSAEIQAKQQLEVTLTEYKQNAAREKEDLTAQVEDLRSSIRRAERQSARQEDSYKAEASDLQRRLLDAERRNQQLADSVAMATQPLLRQLETLQAAMCTQQQNWERAERTLAEKNVELQRQLASVTEREKHASEQYVEACSRTVPLQETVATLRAERQKAVSKAEAAEQRAQAQTELVERVRSEAAATERHLCEQLQSLTTAKDSSERHLEAERTALLAERARNAALQQQLTREHRRQHSTASNSDWAETAASQHESQLSTPRTSPTPSLSRISFSSSFHELTTQSGRSTVVGEGTGQATPRGVGGSLYEVLRAGQGQATVVESITAQLKQREGELQQVRSERAELESARRQLSAELARLSAQLQTQQTTERQLAEQRDRFSKLQSEYNALLQMYGEKAEETDELKLDLADVKEMYRTQIELLTQQLGAGASGSSTQPRS